MERTLTRSLAVLLAILMLVAIFPMSVLAQMLEDGSAETLTPYNDEPFELVELREENVKHFQNADGTVVAAIYPNAVHYKDDDGTWQDIDNTLTGGLVNYSDARERVKFVKKTTSPSFDLSILFITQGHIFAPRKDMPLNFSQFIYVMF